jgi:DNA primase
MQFATNLRDRCDEVRSTTSLSGIAKTALKLRRAGREWKACCPFHADRTPSFTIYADDSRFMCFGCGAEGDVLDFIMRLHGVRLIEALEMLAGHLPSPRARMTHPPADETHDRLAEALAIWDKARPPQGTVAEAYLQSRGIIVPLPETIRFAELPLGRHRPMPTLIAAVTDVQGEVCGIQRTFLCANPIGKAALPGGKVKFSLGRVRGGAIRLGPAARSIVVTEGLEDGLTLLQALGRPVWVAAGAGMLPAMRLPEAVEAVVIGADNDLSGQEAANRAAGAFHDQGRQVRIMSPAKVYKDFNAQLMGKGG